MRWSDQQARGCPLHTAISVESLGQCGTSSKPRLKHSLPVPPMQATSAPASDCTAPSPAMQALPLASLPASLDRLHSLQVLGQALVW